MRPSHRDIYEQVAEANRKLDLLLQHHDVDFSKEDAEARRQTREIRMARHHVPPLSASVQPETK